MTNKELILEYLTNNEEATIRDLMNNCGKWINSPAEYIRQLRDEGYNIETKTKGKHGVYILHLKEQLELI